MAFSPVEIPTNQGISLGSPPAALAPGELMVARNCHYIPEDQTLWKIPGRTLFGNIASATATGLSSVSFRNGESYLIAAAGTTLATAPAGTDGTFTSRKTYSTTSGEMEAVYYNGSNEVYIFDAVNPPQVWSGSGNTRDMGLLAPLGAPTPSLVANAATDYTTGSTFQYCLTEYDSTNDTESVSSSVVQVQTTASNDTVKLALPTAQNSGADKWRIYRSQESGAVMFRLAEIAISNLRYYDGDDSEGLANDTDNLAVWGFASVGDIFISTQPVLPMLGSPISGNYVTVNGKIPNGNILTVFEGSLCVSGVPGYPQDIYYSQTDFPEQFSPLYYLREENERGDPVSGMGVANDRLIAFTLNAVFRHDTLPRVTDPGFGLGISSRQIVTLDQGAVAKRAIVNFGVENPNNRLFYLSSRGPWMTDGYQTKPLGVDLDWGKDYFNMNAIGGAVATNFPKHFQIWLFLPSKGSPTNDVAFIYHYHPYHLKQSTGVGKWTGPIHVRCSAAATNFQKNIESRMYIADANTSGNVFLHDSGDTDAQNYEDASGSIKWEWETGDMVVGGTATKNKRFARVFLTTQGTDSFDPTFKYAMNQKSGESRIRLKTQTNNTAKTYTIGTSEVERPQTRLHRGGIWKTGTHLRLHMTETKAEQKRALVGVEVEAESFGRQK